MKKPNKEDDQFWSELIVKQGSRHQNFLHADWDRATEAYTNYLEMELSNQKSLTFLKEKEGNKYLVAWEKEHAIVENLKKHLKKIPHAKHCGVLSPNKECNCIISILLKS